MVSGEGNTKLYVFLMIMSKLLDKKGCRVDSNLRHNFICNAMGESFWGFQVSLVAPATVLVVLLRDMGASPGFISSLASIDAAFLFLPQFVGAWFFSRFKSLKKPILLWHYLCIIPAFCLIGFFVFLEPWTGPVLCRWLILMAYAMSVFSMGLILSVWWAWLSSIFPEKCRGTVLGVSFFSSAFFGTAAGLLAGWVLSHYPGRHSFIYLYMAAAAIQVLSITIFTFVREPSSDVDIDKAPEGLQDLLSRFRQSIGDSNFREFIFSRILGSMGFCILPLIAVYYSSEAGGNIVKGQLVSYGAAMTVGTALTNLSLGRLGDHFGHRLGIVIGLMAQVLTVTLMLFSRGSISCILVYFGAGICMGSSFISHINMLIETCPHPNRLAHIALGNTMLGAAVIPGPILAGKLFGLYGHKPVFVITLMFSFAALAWVLLRVRDPRSTRVVCK